MKRSKALKIILIAWAIGFLSEREDILHEIINDHDPEDGVDNSHLLTAIIVWFGTGLPKKEVVESFIDHYFDWMVFVHDNLEGILIGDTTIDEVLLEQIMKETWL